ncbi:MAG: hypothetical protein RLZZ337_78 [Bacteroidota bacterium]|jgi:hypothetical protein
MRLLLLSLLFIPIVCLGQHVVHVQNEECDYKKIEVSLVYKNQTDSIVNLTAYEYYDDDWVTLWLNHPLEEADTIIVPASTYFFNNQSLHVDLIHTLSNEIMLDSGCTYSINLLFASDSPTYWYTGYFFILPMYFDLDNAQISDDAKPILNDLLKTMNKYPNLAFEMGVHADERYPNELSTCLSCKRAESIRNYLVENGIDPRRVTAKGYNDSKPKIRNAKSEEYHQKNRRIEITITSLIFEKP